MTRRRRRPRRKSTRAVFIAVAVLAALALAIAGIVYFSGKAGREARKGGPQKAKVESREAASVPVIVGEELLIKGCLYDLGIARERISTKGRTIHASVTRIPSSQRLKKAFASLDREEGIEVDIPQPGRVVIKMNGNTWDVIFERAVPHVGARARVAIIIDDMGQDMAVARRLAAIDADLTFSVLPHLSYTADVARYLHRLGREVLLHMPMEGANGKNPGPGAIYDTTPPADAANMLKDCLVQVPYAVGVNNHMGSVVTRNRAIMESLFDVLKERDLFFVDSLTTNESVCEDAARGAGIMFASRDVFLDNVQDTASISRQVDLLAKIALEKGHAIGICHPHPATVQALETRVPRLMESGIEVVKVSEVVRSLQEDAH